MDLPVFFLDVERPLARTITSAGSGCVADRGGVSGWNAPQWWYDTDLEPRGSIQSPQTPLPPPRSAPLHHAEPPCPTPPMIGAVY